MYLDVVHISAQYTTIDLIALRMFNFMLFIITVKSYYALLLEIINVKGKPAKVK